MSSIQGLLQAHDYKFGRPQGGPSAFSALVEHLQKEQMKRQKLKNVEEQLGQFHRFQEMFNSMDDKTVNGKTAKMMKSDAEQGRRQIGSMQDIVPEYEFGFENGELKTKIGFKTPSETERKAQIERQKVELEIERAQAKENIIDGFIEGSVAEGELIKNMGNLGITIQEFESAISARTRLQGLSLGIEQSQDDTLIQTGLAPNERRMIDRKIIPSSGSAQVGDFEATKLDRDQMGNLIPSGFEKKKPTAAQEKRDVENQELAGQMKNVVDLFNQARDEAEVIPNFGESGDIKEQGFLGAMVSGTKGRIAGKLAKKSADMGALPSVQAFNDSVKAFATIAAKSSGEQRPTDEDINRFLGSLMSTEGSDKENAIKMSQQIKNLRSKGINVDWAIPLTQQFQERTGVAVDLGTNGLQVGRFIIEEE